MKSRTFTAALGLFLAAAPLGATEDKVSLTHRYVEGEQSRYKIEFSMDQGGNPVQITGEVLLTIKKTLDDGGADFEMKIEKFESPMGIDGTGTFKSKFDKFGMSPDLETRDQAVLLVIYSICNYLPKDEVTLGKVFPIDWKSGGSGLTVKGEGTVDSAKPGDDGKTKIRYGLEVTPPGDTPGKVTSTSTFLTKTGKLLESTGTVVISDGTASFKITRLPDKKS
ncbi:MAG: hypothetical protein K1X67_19375 [Fimbriimonadaceae bacterium]|nr:hypothetical protein [Fimbriimonadaceae bacterium]